MTQENSKPFKYQWATIGDINGFFGLMLDNVTVMVLMSMILIFGFGFPKQFIYTHMLPGTALGVLIGDVVYTIMAFKLAKKTRRQVTAMPLGLDTPSTIGIALAVLGPTYLASRDPYITWYVGMTTLVFIGIIKVVFSYIGGWVQKIVPQAGLLGSLAGIGLALLCFLPLVEIFKMPIVGIVALGLIFYTLVAKIRLPWNFPGAFAAVLAGTAIYYILGPMHILPEFHLPVFSFNFALPMPNFAFLDKKIILEALKYLPIAIPFGLLTIVGGINVTESAKVGGDDYNTKDILMTEAISTLIAGVCGGVAQSTPYIGQPAYKKMGSRAAYTLATGIFIGLGGIFGYISTIVDMLPTAALAPILIFVGVDIVEQAFFACPRKHAPAVSMAFLPIVADLVYIKISTFIDGFNSMLAKVPVDVMNNYNLAAIPVILQHEYDTIMMLGHGFILTGMLWGAIIAFIIDRKLIKAAIYLAITAAFTLFGVIHSASPMGDIYLPWKINSLLPFHFAAGYLILAIILVVLSFSRSSKQSTEYGDEEVSTAF